MCACDHEHSILCVLGKHLPLDIGTFVDVENTLLLRSCSVTFCNEKVLKCAHTHMHARTRTHAHAHAHAHAHTHTHTLTPLTLQVLRAKDYTLILGRPGTGESNDLTQAGEAEPL